MATQASELEAAWHALSVDEVVTKLATSRTGLSENEAKRRLQHFGFNELEPEKKTSPLGILLRQFKNILILILLAAVFVAFVAGETIDAVVILVIVAGASALGFVQEFRAEHALEALKRMAALTASVVRDGEEHEVPARELVLGDLIRLTDGDRVPADARLVEAVNLKVDEASLTGESLPIQKECESLPMDLPLAERRNLVYAGTTVTYGRGSGIVYSTGLRTEFGKIAGIIRSAPKIKTPLEIRIERLGRLLSAVVVSIAVLILVLGLLRGETLPRMMLWSISLAVAAVPEALPAVVTAGLAIGVRNMARRKAIVRRLAAVETLGSTTVICSDKTGTMTKGQQTVRKVFVGLDSYDVTGTGYGTDGQILRNGHVANDKGLSLLVKLALLCNDAHVSKGSPILLGDPTEIALVVAALKAGESEDVRTQYSRIDEIPFSSARKRMTTIHRTPEGSIICVMKGAAEIVLERCDGIYDNGLTRTIDANIRVQVLRLADAMASEALRVIAFGYKVLPSHVNRFTEEECERGLVFLGLMGMIDPPRDEAKEAVQKCRTAGIKVVMITGDHRLTAKAIANELGLLDENSTVITGRELDTMTDEQLEETVERTAVYARVSPEHKMRIVKALRKKGHITAMTGDGVNDAPALKFADIGVAMGITGTDVTKETADMILADDNFATIVSAIEEGRRIFDNIKKYLVYLLESSIGEVAIFALAMMMQLPLPLLPKHILYINLATDGLPAMALGVDPPEPGIMNRPPRNPKLGVFSDIKWWIIGLATLFILGTFGVFYFALSANSNGDGGIDKVRTMVFVSVILFEIFLPFSLRSLRASMVNVGVLRNKFLVAAVLWEMSLLVLLVNVPLLETAFGLVPLSATEWIMITGLAASRLVALELAKLFLRGFSTVPPLGHPIQK